MTGESAGRGTSSFARPAAGRAPGMQDTALAIVDCRAIDSAGDAGLAVTRGQPRDPLVAALARYIEALHRRYPDGPDQMRREALDRRANMRTMSSRRKGRAA